MIRKSILFLLLSVLSYTAHSQKLIAHYTMDGTTEDHIGFHKHLLTPNCSYEKGGIKSIGKYASAENGKCDIHAVNIEELDINEFAFSMEIMTEKVQSMNVMTFNRTCRLLGCKISQDGYFVFTVNNGDLTKTSFTKCLPNTWYTITISYNTKTQRAKMYVNEKLVGNIHASLSNYCMNSSYISKDISTTEYSSGSVFKGFCKNLLVINGPYTPADKDKLKKTARSSGDNIEHGQGTIPRFAHGQPMKELNAKEYRELAKTGVAFINFAQPFCDLDEYYIESIAEINEQLPKIPIYSFNRNLYPEIEKEFKLWGAERLAMVKDGNFVSHFEGFHGLNQTKKWIIEEWNKDKGTKYPLPKERFTSRKQQGNLDIKSYHALSVSFNENFDNVLTGSDGFSNNEETTQLVNNVLSANGKYSSKTSSSAFIENFDKGNFSIYLEFMPHLTVSNNVICLDRSYRDFSIVVWENKIGFRLDNGSYAYLEEDIEIKKFQWNALALSYDDKAKELQVVLNGEKLKNFKVDEHIKINPNSYAKFNVTNFSNGNVFKGYLDDFNVYTTALKDKNLMNMYNTHAGNFTDMSYYLPKDLVGDFKFDDKNNEINNLEELILISDASRLNKGVLYLSDEFSNMPIVLTEALPVDPRDITISFDFNTNQLLDFAEVFELEGKYSHNYINFNIINGDIQVVLDYYSDDKEYKALRYETENQPIKENTWYNFVLSFNEKNKQLYVYLNGKEVMNKEYSSEETSKKNTDYSKIIFQKHTFKGSTFTGYIDNLKLFSKAFTSAQIDAFYANHRDHIAVSVAELSHEPTVSHHDQVGFKLHQWSDNDYNEFDYDEFSNIIAINTPIDPNNFDQDLMNACIFYHTNYQRKKFGKQPFSHKSALEKAATMHSTDMTLYGFFDHINHYDSKKAKPHMRIARFGITEGSTSENIATRFESNISYWFLAAQLVQQWMDSPSHRRNILDDRMNSLGCGVALIVDEDDSHSVSYYGTQNFSSLK